MDFTIPDNDDVLKDITKNNPYYVNIKGSYNICLISCGQELSNYENINIDKIQNYNSQFLILTSNYSNCILKLAKNPFTHKENIFYFEKIMITVPALHRMDDILYDMETFIIFSQTKMNNKKVYICICVISKGVDIINPDDSSVVHYTLMKELLSNTNKIPDKNSSYIIKGSPNPIDLSHLIPADGNRSFFSYIHQNNNLVNFRVYNKIMSVSNNLLDIIKIKLINGKDYNNFKNSILNIPTTQVTQPYIYFSKDISENYKSYSKNSNSIVEQEEEKSKMNPEEEEHEEHEEINSEEEFKIKKLEEKFDSEEITYSKQTLGQQTLGQQSDSTRITCMSFIILIIIIFKIINYLFVFSFFKIDDNEKFYNITKIPEKILSINRNNIPSNENIDYIEDQLKKKNLDNQQNNNIPTDHYTEFCNSINDYILSEILINRFRNDIGMIFFILLSLVILILLIIYSLHLIDDNILLTIIAAFLMILVFIICKIFHNQFNYFKPRFNKIEDNKYYQTEQDKYYKIWGLFIPHTIDFFKILYYGCNIPNDKTIKSFDVVIKESELFNSDNSSNIDYYTSNIYYYTSKLFVYIFFVYIVCYLCLNAIISFLFMMNNFSFTPISSFINLVIPLLANISYLIPLYIFLSLLKSMFNPLMGLNKWLRRAIYSSIILFILLIFLLNVIFTSTSLNPSFTATIFAISFIFSFIFILFIILTFVYFRNRSKK